MQGVAIVSQFMGRLQVVEVVFESERGLRSVALVGTGTETMDTNEWPSLAAAFVANNRQHTTALLIAADSEAALTAVVGADAAQVAGMVQVLPPPDDPAGE